MNRREFLKTAAFAAAAAATIKMKPFSLWGADEITENADLAAVRGSDPVTMFRKGIEALGGMKRFVKPGQKVAVKPNIGWDQPPEMAANTNPELVGEIVRQAIAAGASKVVVFDHSCDETKACCRRSGIEDAVKSAGAELVFADRTDHYEEKSCPSAVSMKKALVHKELLNADVVINVPVLKHHGGARMTSAMKNYMGVVWDRGFMHRNKLPQCIADSILYRKPDLNVIDAYRVMVSNGPRGRSEKDVRLMKYQILSTDIVAADAMAAKLMKYSLHEVPYIQLGEKLGLGVSDPSKLRVRRIDA